MEKSTTATFIGHSECYGLDEGRVRATIEQLIHAGITTFLCGGMGAFDWLCARQVYQAKQQYSSEQPVHDDIAPLMFMLFSRARESVGQALRNTPPGNNSIQPCAQVSTHLPQPVQFHSMMLRLPSPLPAMASNRHAFWQSPQPVQSGKWMTA